MLPQRIGRYLVDRELGEGAFGKVWLAHDVETFERSVAVKVLKADRASRDVEARFRAEQSALGMMDHEFITKIYEIGQTDDGRPYFVMEYADGVPITTYCEQRQLDLPARLRLFQEVCAGVQHAHQKGVIHRDLKPSNLLIVERAGQPVPKIIDFGLARGEDRLLTGQLPTLGGDVLGTLAYMSPEQARGARDIDTRADLYSLGVVLYEMLAGVLPFDLEQLAASGAQATLQQLFAAEPPPPSARAGEPLSHRLRGDLDQIVMKLLDLDRDRRYATVGALRDDIDRHLGHEPVLARPPSRIYRMRKFVRRHRAQVVIAVTAALLLVAVAVGTTVGLLLARDNERLARAQVEAAQRRERDDARALFRSAQQAAARGDWVVALEQYDRAARAGFGVEQPVALAIGRIEALEGSLDLLAASAELERLQRQHGDALGEHRAKVLLLAGDVGVDRLHSPDANLDLVRQAVALGTLAAADDSYARALLATDAGTAIEHLRQARRQQPHHRRATDALAISLLLCGRLDEAVTLAEVMRALYPDDGQALTYAAFVTALRGEAERAEAIVEHIRARIDEDTAAMAAFGCRAASLITWFNDTVRRRLVDRDGPGVGGLLRELMVPIGEVLRGQQALERISSDRQRGIVLLRVAPAAVRAYQPLFRVLPQWLFDRDGLLQVLDATRDASVDGVVPFGHGLLLMRQRRYEEAAAALARASRTPSVVITPATMQLYLVAVLSARVRELDDEGERLPVRQRAAAAIVGALQMPGLRRDELEFLSHAAVDAATDAVALEVTLRWTREFADDAAAHEHLQRILARLQVQRR